MSRYFKNGTAFPSEGFVQQAIEAYFAHLGYSLHTDTDVDLICTASDGRASWHIEAKGKTRQVGLISAPVSASCCNACICATRSTA